jgi:hypothetical protein
MKHRLTQRGVTMTVRKTVTAPLVLVLVLVPAAVEL